MIQNGRISPWVIYNCEDGVTALGNLDETQVATVYDMINPDYWKPRFKKYAMEVRWVKELLEKAGFAV